MKKTAAGIEKCPPSAYRQSVDTLSGKIRKCFLILHGLIVKGGLPSPLHDPPMLIETLFFEFFDGLHGGH